MDPPHLTASGMIVAFALLGRGRMAVWLYLLVAAAAVIFFFDVPWLTDRVPFLSHFGLSNFFSDRTPVITIVSNVLALGVAVWCLVRIFKGRDTRKRLARKLKNKGDHLGAAEILLQAGHETEALALFQKARAWARAAVVAESMGLEMEAAALMRKAGGRHLADATRLYRRRGEIDLAQQCSHELARWHQNQGHYDEAIEAWLKAGEPARAVRAVMASLEKRRLKPSQPSFRAALRAADETRDHQCMARLREMEGNWAASAESWRLAGHHEHAARNFLKVGLLDEAAKEEAAAGHPQASAGLRIQRLKGLLEKVKICHTKGPAGAPEAARLQRVVDRETSALIPLLSELGMESEVIDILNTVGRTDEAVQRLVASGKEAAAAELARNAQEWETAASILEGLERYGEASDLYELAEELDKAALCAEKSGEDERALQLYRGLGKTVRAAECMARIGLLQDALKELHNAGELSEACAILKRHPGPVPDIPDVVMDMAHWLRANGTLDEAIACLQRAVLGVALQPGRLDPAVALAKLLFEAGELDAAHAQGERVLAFDYSHRGARDLVTEIDRVRSTPDPAATVAAPGVAVSTDQTARSEYQRYEILNELGRGGMGVVYRARDTRLDRDVAIKVLKTTSKEEAVRLEQEAKVAATLNHPGIVTVYDFEAGFDGYFIAMEYVPGETLDKVLKVDHRRILENLQNLLTRLAEAVSYAHTRKVIHRDLKPGNVILSPGFDVKILDFGIAARIDSGHTTKPSVVGTPFYMAPEQIRGEIPTPATDIYAFGATAFHLATGRPPFKKGNVIEAHLSEAPPNPQDLAPDLDAGMAQIILRCLEKDPEDRYPSGTQLHTALRGK